MEATIKLINSCDKSTLLISSSPDLMAPGPATAAL